ncbi:small membrane protein YoaI, partial [Escherichia coli]
MNDQMFVETLIITSSFFAIAVVLVLSVLLIRCAVKPR